MESTWLRDPRGPLGRHVNEMYGYGPIEQPGHQAGCDLFMALEPFKWYSLQEIEMTAARLALRYKRTRGEMWVALYQRAMEGYCKMLAMGAAR